MFPTTPMPYESLDGRFRNCFGDVQLETLYTGCRWAEGPVYFPAGRYLIWSDIPNDRLLRWDELTGRTGVFRESAGFPNGNAVDGSGRLITCEQGRRRITRTEHDGSVTVLVDRYSGMQLNSPNDAAVARDGALWFTDASYGIDNDYEGVRAESEIGACNVYRADPKTGGCTMVADGFVRPTGIGFSPDQQRLYVADSRGNHIRAFDVVDGRSLVNDRVVAVGTCPSLDSMSIDTDGRIWIAALDGVHAYLPDGTLLGKIRLPVAAANVEFGGPRRNVLFITASTTVYSIMLAATGVSRF